MRPIAALTEAARDIATTRDPSLRIPRPRARTRSPSWPGRLIRCCASSTPREPSRERTIQRQREFVADASHELRTPLTSILANLELLEAELREHGDDDEPGGDRLRAALARGG